MVLGERAARRAAEFLAAHLPREARGWQDLASTACQIGCAALAALGQARRTVWGAEPVEAPALPGLLPRWDDIAVAVLWLAVQRYGLGWRRMDGSEEPPRGGGYVIRRLDSPPPPPPNIAPGPGSGPALASPEVVELLKALGLVAQGRWTAAAETVLWRGEPGEWGLRVEEDPRFQAAAKRAVATLPGGLHNQMAKLVRISPADVEEAMRRHEASRAELRAKHGPNVRTGPQPTAEGMRRGLVFSRRDALDWLFFRNWRLEEGWLAEDDPRPRLEIFHDRLATRMRQAVVAQVFPGFGA